MNTQLLRSGCMLIVLASFLAFSSCENEEIAAASITVMEEYAATQGPVNQLKPVEGVRVRIYGPAGSDHLETVLFTDANGTVNYTYDYDAFLFCDLELGNRISIRNHFQLKKGETTKTQVILPD